MSAPSKDLLIALLSRWIHQRPGLDFRNYCSGWHDHAGRRAYFSEMRSITKDLHDARELLRAVELSGITGEELAAAFPRAFSGRLTLKQRIDGKWALDYCTGQYWPTEYRRAACAVLASALWDYKRDKCMPAPSGKVARSGFEHDAIDGIPPGDWLRRSFRREYGRSIASRWFS